jgi:hypothetical protein
MTEAELRADLIARWQGAFARRSEVDREPEGELVYSQYPAFLLEGYSVKVFKPGARLQRGKPPKTDVFVFRLDAQGRPVWSRFVHGFNRSETRGIYRYSAGEVEHLEFSCGSGVPSLYDRVVIEGDNVVAAHRLLSGDLDGAAARGSAAKKAKSILETHDFKIFMTRYQISRGVVTSGEEYHEWDADKIYRPRRHYHYAADGKLERIVQHWPDGEQRVVFAQKSKVTLASLSEHLSGKIAEDILARLKAAALADPLVALELTYRDGQRHVPTLVPLTTRDRPASLTLATEIGSRRWLELSDENFADALADFNARVESSENATAVAKMLRAAARRVTERAPSAVATAEGFVAFAVDWELEGESLATILKQCGAPPEKLRAWKKIGWI